MATRINTCSSSSLKHDIHIPTRRFTSLSSRTSHTSKWIPQISSRTHAKRNLVLKSSNGNPLKAVPLQDGEFLIPQFALFFFCLLLVKWVAGVFPAYAFLFFCLPVFIFLDVWRKCSTHHNALNHYICWIGFMIVLSLSLLTGILGLSIWKKEEQHCLHSQDKKPGTKRNTGGYL